jgi:hypothetical protein
VRSPARIRIEARDQIGKAVVVEALQALLELATGGIVNLHRAEGGRLGTTTRDNRHRDSPTREVD